MVEGAVEDRLIKQGVNSNALVEVPHDAAAVVRGRNDLRSIGAANDRIDWTSMFLDRVDHQLGIGQDLPYANLPILATAHHPPFGSKIIIAGTDRQRRYLVCVSIGNHKLELATLGIKGADLAIGPRRNNGGARWCNVDGIARCVGNLNAQQLLPLLGIPHPNVLYGCRHKDVGAVGWKFHIGDGAKMARCSQFGRKGRDVNAVALR
mmetsp:Transcript_30591/g.89388  ORF Transcript_30591/g.89388 Transcript_30591/m.89388 type:complete len:207 (+) Transcript_30591:82-702(+)